MNTNAATVLNLLTLLTVLAALDVDTAEEAYEMEDFSSLTLPGGVTHEPDGRVLVHF